jgi:hypothetical protein
MIDERDEDEQRGEIERKRLEEGVSRLNEVEQVKWLMEKQPFRDFIWRVLARCNVFASVWDQNYGRMSLMEGQRNIGLWLLKELAEASPDQFLAMQQKANRAAGEEARESREAAARKRSQS